MHTSACFKIVDKCKISKFARFKFKDFSRIFKHLICFKHFQGPWSFYSKFKHFQGFLKHDMLWYAVTVVYGAGKGEVMWSRPEITVVITLGRKKSMQYVLLALSHR